MAIILILDSSTIITLASTCLLWVLKKLKEQKPGIEYYIPASVKKEIVDRPINSMKWGFQARRVKKAIGEGLLRLWEDSAMVDETKDFLGLCNSLFEAKKRKIEIVHEGEGAVVTAAKELGAGAVLVDEKTTRMIIEDPKKLRSLLESKLHTRVRIDLQKLKELKRYTSNIKVLRSSELVFYAYNKGIIPGFEKNDSEVISSILWALRFAGCSISSEEIKEYKKIVGEEL